MTKGIFYFIAICCFVASCHAQEAPKNFLDVDIKENFKNYLLTEYDDIKISEIYSKNSNKKSYLQKSLGDSLVKEVIDVKSHDIYFKELSLKYEAHLGIAYLRYETAGNAKNAISHIEKKGFFENTKILTKYVVINVDAVNLIVYTESSANKNASAYLDFISSKVFNESAHK
jgi:hypothetical protein